MTTITIPDDLPIEPLRDTLYTPGELSHGFDHGGFRSTRDQEIRQWHLRSGATEKDRLAQVVHDHSMDQCVAAFIGSRGAKLVGIAGGHDVPRSDATYLRVIDIALRLTSAGYTVVTAGGLGLMEAANFGAWLEGVPSADRVSLVRELQKVPRFEGHEDEYAESAMMIRNRYQGSVSLAVPTWMNEGEPVSQFATHIAKYFANSIREDGLLSIAMYGVVYARGGAGTIQEIFQNAARNDYGSSASGDEGRKWRSPMVFIGSDFFDVAGASVFRLVAAKATGNYDDMIHLTDDAADAVRWIVEHPPRLAEEFAPKLGNTTIPYPANALPQRVPPGYVPSRSSYPAFKHPGDRSPHSGGSSW